MHCRRCLLQKERSFFPGLRCWPYILHTYRLTRRCAIYPNTCNQRLCAVLACAPHGRISSRNRMLIHPSISTLRYFCLPIDVAFVWIVAKTTSAATMAVGCIGCFSFPRYHPGTTTTLHGFCCRAVRARCEPWGAGRNAAQYNSHLLPGHTCAPCVTLRLLRRPACYPLQCHTIAETPQQPNATYNK